MGEISNAKNRVKIWFSCRPGYYNCSLKVMETINKVASYGNKEKNQTMFVLNHFF